MHPLRSTLIWSAAVVTVLTVDAPPFRAATSAGLAVDLTYRSILSENGVTRDSWLAKWLRSHRPPPIERTLKRWGGGPTRALIILDHPAFHAGERMSSVLVSGEKEARVWVFVDGELQTDLGGPLSRSVFDEFLKTASLWDQGPPLGPKQAGTDAPPGYFGFLTILNGASQRQILLSLNDFFVSTEPSGGDPSDGRVTVAIRPVMNDAENGD